LVARESRRGLSPRRILALVALAFVVLAGTAMLRTSATFDEIVFLSVGARGLRTGDYSMVDDHPRLAQYLFGVPAWLEADHYPPESAHWSWISRYQYSRVFLWGVGNASERILMAARLVGLLCGLGTVLGAFFFSRRYLGEWGALLAAGLTAFLPDVLAQSGVAYNDIAVTLGFLAGVHLLDAAVRRPAPGRVALAAGVTALTACVKYSGLLLFPVLAGLLVLEAASGRWRERPWLRAVALGIPVFAAVFWGVVALLYLGDWSLSDFFRGLHALTKSSSTGRVAFLLGQSRDGGWWYFFPVAFALKTPLAFQLLLVAAAALAVTGAVRGGDSMREYAAHGLRAPALGAILYLAAAMTSGFNIGVRHVLPTMPLLCILAAAGGKVLWEGGGRSVRAAVAVLVAGLAISTLGAYPNFLSYLSEDAMGRGPRETLVDSNTDWGQGLLQLRDFMRSHRIERVALGYFGSAPPEAYGIRFVPLPSFLELPDPPREAQAPRFIVVSATLLTGNYLHGDPYAALRQARPVAIVGGSLYVFDRAALGTL